MFHHLENIENHLNNISINPLRHIKRKIQNPFGSDQPKTKNGKSV